MDELTNNIKKCINKIAEKFRENPFKYFAERDLHFQLQEEFKKIYPNGPYYVHFEFPVLVENFEFGKGDKKPRKTAAIDIVINEIQNEKTEVPLIGIEMFLGKFNDEGLIKIGNRKELLTKSGLTADKALEHLQGDSWKLKRITPENYFLIYYITHVFTRKTEGRRKERIKRISQITDALRNYSEIDQSRLIIIETLYENGLKTNREKLGLPQLQSNLPIVELND